VENFSAIWISQFRIRRININCLRWNWICKYLQLFKCTLLSLLRECLCIFHFYYNKTMMLLLLKCCNWVCYLQTRFCRKSLPDLNLTKNNWNSNASSLSSYCCCCCWFDERVGFTKASKGLWNSNVSEKEGNQNISQFNGLLKSNVSLVL